MVEIIIKQKFQFSRFEEFCQNSTSILYRGCNSVLQPTLDIWNTDISKHLLTILHSEQPKLSGVLAFMSVIGLYQRKQFGPILFKFQFLFFRMTDGTEILLWDINNLEYILTLRYQELTVIS